MKSLIVLNQFLIVFIGILKLIHCSHKSNNNIFDQEYSKDNSQLKGQKRPFLPPIQSPPNDPIDQLNLFTLVNAPAYKNDLLNPHQNQERPKTRSLNVSLSSNNMSPPKQQSLIFDKLNLQEIALPNSSQIESFSYNSNLYQFSSENQQHVKEIILQHNIQTKKVVNERSTSSLNSLAESSQSSYVAMDVDVDISMDLENNQANCTTIRENLHKLFPNLNRRDDRKRNGPDSRGHLADFCNILKSAIPKSIDNQLLAETEVETHFNSKLKSFKLQSSMNQVLKRTFYPIIMKHFNCIFPITNRIESSVFASLIRALGFDIGEAKTFVEIFAGLISASVYFNICVICMGLGREVDSFFLYENIMTRQDMRLVFREHIIVHHFYAFSHLGEHGPNKDRKRSQIIEDLWEVVNNLIEIFPRHGKYAPTNRNIELLWSFAKDCLEEDKRKGFSTNSNQIHQSAQKILEGEGLQETAELTVDVNGLFREKALIKEFLRHEDLVFKFKSWIESVIVNAGDTLKMFETSLNSLSTAIEIFQLEDRKVRKIEPIFAFLAEWSATFRSCIICGVVGDGDNPIEGVPYLEENISQYWRFLSHIVSLHIHPHFLLQMKSLTKLLGDFALMQKNFSAVLPSSKYSYKQDCVKIERPVDQKDREELSEIIKKLKETTPPPLFSKKSNEEIILRNNSRKNQLPPNSYVNQIKRQSRKLGILSAKRGSCVLCYDSDKVFPYIVTASKKSFLDSFIDHLLNAHFKLNKNHHWSDQSLVEMRKYLRRYLSLLKKRFYSSFFVY